MKNKQMNPYEYLLKILGVQIIDINCKYSDHILYRKLWFKKQNLGVIPIKTTAKEIFQYYNIVDLQREAIALDLIKILRQFPAELESKEHVDLLLAVNGMNIEA